MKRMNTKKNRSVFKLGFVSAVAAAGVGSAYASVNTLSTFTSSTALDNAANWTPNGIPPARMMRWWVPVIRPRLH